MHTMNEAHTHTHTCRLPLKQPFKATCYDILIIYLDKEVVRVKATPRPPTLACSEIPAQFVCFRENPEIIIK